MRFTHRLVFRSLKHANQWLRVLEDEDGWLWVERLVSMGQAADAGPFTRSLLAQHFEVEPQEAARRALPKEAP